MATSASTTLAAISALLLKAGTVSAVLMRADAVLDTRGLNPLVRDLLYTLDAAAISLSKALSDASPVLDAQSIDNGKTVQDTVTATDNFSYNAQFQRAFDELQQVLDLVQSTVGKGIDDTTQMQDVSIFTTAQGSADAYAMTDASALATARSTDDPYTLSDASVTSFDKQSSDTSLVVDAGLVSNQNYAEPNYFAADYVGDSRTF